MINLGVKNIIFSTWWVNVRLGQTALEVAQSLSLVLDVNLFSSNVVVESSGTAVFSKGKLIKGTSKDDTVVMTVDTDNMDTFDDFTATEDPKLKMYVPITPNPIMYVDFFDKQVVITNLTNGQEHLFLETQTFTCEVIIEAQNPNPNEYFRVRAGGFLPLGAIAFDSCGIVNCGADPNCSEEYNVQSSVSFNVLDITMTYKQQLREVGDGVVGPLGASSGLNVFDIGDMLYEETIERTEYNLEYEGDDKVVDMYITRVYSNPYI